MKRTQKQRPYTGRKKKILIILVPAILIIIAAMLIISGIFIRKNNISKTAEFVPPEYESMAQEGIPSLDESYLYGEVPTKFNYGFSMAMNLYMQKDKSLNVYFTNPATNTISNTMLIIAAIATNINGLLESPIPRIIAETTLYP